MTVHEKLAARLRELAERLHETHCHEPKLAVFRSCESLAEYVEAGDLDDILGAREPTIKAVDAESRRVFGRKASAEHNKAYDVVEVRITRGAWIDVRRTYVSIPEAFGALRALPDYEGEK